MSYSEFDDDTFGEFDGRSSRRPREKSGCLVGGIVGGGLVVLLCCGGGTALVMFGMNVVTREVEVALRDNEVLVEHLGQIESFELDWSASIAADGDDVWVYRVSGTKGTGEITAKSITGPDDNEQVIWAKLRLPTGEVLDLVSEE